MLQGWVIIICALGYLGLLFALASWGDRRADSGRSIINRPTVYVLSLAVYCTSWTFYGSVGRAASRGVEFLTIYLGPTLMAAFSWLILRKIVRISKTQRITSIADFISARYGKSAALGGLVTIIATLGVIPYIALQLKAISASIAVLLHYPDPLVRARAGEPALATDTAFYVAFLLAAFTIIFGTRHTDATERHEGMVAALAFDSLVKLGAFIAVGIFVTFGIFDGFGDLSARARDLPQVGAMLTINGTDGWGSWTALTLLSMLAILCLPRQFQLAVVELVDEQHLRRATWLFPLYLLAINLFVLPIAIGGLLLFPAGVDPDMFVLTLPMAAGQQGLALLVFLGGLSAATGMVIAEAIALSTMLTNSLAVPILLRLGWSRGEEGRDLTGPLLLIRRGAIGLVMALGYLYFRLAGEVYALVSIGLVSFAAVAQFAPALLGGLFWKGGTRRGALCGLSAGFAVWAYTLLFPSFVQSGWWPRAFLESGPFGLTFLKPQALFGLAGLEQNAHALFWSMLANIGAYTGVSLWAEQSATERRQATLFVDIFRAPHAAGQADRHYDRAALRDLRQLLARFLGTERAAEALADYARQHGLADVDQLRGDRAFIEWAETTLAGTIGAASARVLIVSVAEEADPGLDEMMHILDEASQVIAYSHQLEEKGRALERATAELRAANDRLQELDRLKDEFVATITHELRTPLTSIRAFSEILHENPDLDPTQRAHFLAIIISESERLTRLINQTLDLAKLESGLADWQIVPLDPGAIIEEAVAAASGSVEARNARLQLDFPDEIPLVLADHDRLVQVVVNLLSNAAKFCAREAGLIAVHLESRGEMLRIAVADNGPGIPPAQREAIFERFRQGGTTLIDKPQGTGLGLPISRQIVARLGGTIWVAERQGGGAVFTFTLPLAPAAVVGERAPGLTNVVRDPA